MPLPAVSLGRRVSQWFLLGTAAPLVVLVMWLPALFMPDGESLSHGGLTLLMAGLCLALSVGSGIFQHTKAMVLGGTYGDQRIVYAVNRNLALVGVGSLLARRSGFCVKAPRCRADNVYNGRPNLSSPIEGDPNRD